ncbi:MAG: phospholipid carrier-dependent glycosyltransferase [Lachnospiraceae bacterium]|jgi:dolichyl-phosphate-mannose-protein mannosyltransferase|nr:phospholipid carrier-dependent glycosyltransferase [Lachnospiraceae bacterium]MEE3460814.1 phospholipid carrier-dependent glycosyltransferase [Lachnospiraceae bacterium]
MKWIAIIDVLYTITACWLFFPVLRTLKPYAGKLTAGRNDLSSGKNNSGAGSDNRSDKKLNDPYRTFGTTLMTIVLVMAFLVRILIIFVTSVNHYYGYKTDMDCFTYWADYVFKGGFGNFYNTDVFTDYPPGYIYLLWIPGAIRNILHLQAYDVLNVILIKLPSVISDILTGYIIYKAASGRFNYSGAAIVTALYLFCPSVILDGTVWGQTDAVFTLGVVLFIWLITEKKLIPAYFVYMAAVLIKPQTIIFTPVLIFAVLNELIFKDFELKRFLKHLGIFISAAASAFIAIMPYGLKSALSQYISTVGSYRYASTNAYNFWTLIGRNWKPQTDRLFGLTCQTWGAAAIVLTVILAFVIFYRLRNEEHVYFISAAFIICMVFTFAVRMHERYIFPALALLSLTFVMKPVLDHFLLYIFVAFFSFMNMAHVLFFYDPNNYDFHNKIFYIVGGLTVFTALIFLAVSVHEAVDPAAISFDPADDLETEGSEELSDNDKRSAGKYSEKKGNKHKSSAKSAGIRKSKNKKSYGLTGAVLKLIKNSRPAHKAQVTPSEKTVNMTRRDWIIVCVIAAVYAAISFYHLGDRIAPETTYSVVKEGDVTVDFGKDVNVGAIWTYLGYKNDALYTLEYMPDGGVWTSFNAEGNPWDTGGVFAWETENLGVTARYIRLAPAKDNTEDSICELVFTDPDGKELEPVNKGDYPELFDEQDLFSGAKTNLNSTFFDEVYHGRTAYEMIHGLYCYENTHPPLGKELIAVGILMFGMNPFGWRFMGNILGILMVFVMYLFAKQFFRKTDIATAATLLFTFDFMHFVQTRIATIDVFVVFFIMLSYYFMYLYITKSFYDTKLKKTFIPLLFCGTAMGLSIASKWTGIYSAAGLAIIIFISFGKRIAEYYYALKDPEGVTNGIAHETIIRQYKGNMLKTIGFCVLVFILLPLIIYCLSYIPFNDGSDRGFFRKIIAAQYTMYNYHAHLNATHPFSSWWYQWPIMYRPIWYYSRVLPNGLREGISAFGNPLVWWAGIPASLIVLYWALVKRDKRSIFLSIGYLVQYAPWFLVTRIVFIYHYFPSVPFVTMSLAYCFDKLIEKNRRFKKPVYIYTALAIVMFVVFYPVLSGYPISAEYGKHLKWFKSWVLLDTWTK